MAQSSNLEHRMRMPAHGAGQGKGAKPEKLLNAFARCLALIERLGNALGTLAFTWATVVLLGGYPTVVCDEDFWFATIIVFLEAARMFSRNNKLDYQLFFHTRGALRPLGWSGLVVITWLSSMANYVLAMLDKAQLPFYALLFLALLLMLVLVVPAILGLIKPSRALKLLPKRVHHAISLFSPLVAILLMGPLLIAKFTSKHIMAKWIVFILLSLAVLLLTISKLHYFPRIIKLAEHAMGNNPDFWRRIILNLCMLVALGLLVSMPDDIGYQVLVLLYELYAFVFVSFGSLQFPAAVTRVVLSLSRLVPQKYYRDGQDGNLSNVNLVPTLNIFYAMVLGQGILYIVACILDIFSFFPKRSLVHRGGFRGEWGVESVNLYYAYALEKSMEGDMLAPKNISLFSFAMDFLNTDIPKKQLHGIRTMHSLLQREATRAQLLLKLTTSTKMMAILIEILDWSSLENATIRLFSAKVTAEIATSLRVITIPGTIQVVSALLDHGNQQKRGNPLLHTDAKHDNEHGTIPINADDNQEQRLDADPNTSSLLETQERSTQQVGTPWKLRCWQRISEFWSIPQEELSTDEDLLPALGLSILDGLVSCDQDNCVEISTASGLIPKIISFTSCWRSDTMYTDTQRKVLVKSSVKLLHNLTSFNGEIGIAMRQKIFKHPFLTRNLAHILGDSMSSKELRKLVAGILRNLAIDKNARQAIGRSQMIISRLMNAFLTPSGTSSTDDDRLLRKVAGQALAMLATDSVHNCLAMLRETGHEFIKELTSMIHVDRYRCVAASLLQSLCRHAGHELKETDLKELSCSLREVLERIPHAEGAELEILIGLSSQISKAIPEEFAREFKHGQINKGTFVKLLVDVLNANVELSTDWPGIRRVILEHAINLMEYDARYVNCFHDHHMMGALSMVEETISEDENCNICMGDAELMEAGEPLPSLVARAKQLLAVDRTCQ